MNVKCLSTLEFNKIKEILKKYTNTPAAKDIIDELVPYENIYEVNEHLEETKEASKLLYKKGSPPFDGLYDVRNAVSRAGKGSVLNPEHLLKISNMLRCSRRFKEYVSHKDNEEIYRVLEDICEGIVPMKSLEDSINLAIVGENEISDRASTTLFNIRRTLKDKNASIKDKINSLMRNNSRYLQDNLYTIRGDRYVLPVKAEFKGSVPGLVHDQSSTGSTLFIEPMSLVNLNNEIKELMLKEKAEIERILAELSGKIYDSIISVRNNSLIVCELDFIFAKAKYAEDIKGTFPNVNKDGVIDIIEGRHPLIDPLKVVPISIYLGREFTSLIITGPNTGGKTVTLKTVGLIHLMAMSGMLIPARENSTVCFFEEIYADIGDEQSIEQSLSTFSSHMTNIVNIINKANEHSLVLFDELGAGTDPNEGSALAIAILEELRSRKSRVVATTHYSELKAYALRTTNVENASVEFDVETLSPTYRLLIGIPGKSNAFEISRRLGLPEYIINASKEKISTDTMQFEDLIKGLQEKTIKAEEDARKAETVKYEVMKLKEKYEDKLYSLQNLREKTLIEAQREAKKIIKDAKDDGDSILKNMRELERMGYTSEARQMLEEERSKLKTKFDNLDKVKSITKLDNGEGLSTVKEGQEVFLPRFNQTVIVLSKPDNKGEVQVQAGIMKINVKLIDLRKNSSSSNSNEPRRNVKREVNLSMESVSSSFDMRGMDAEEGYYSLDKYIDEAYVAGLKEITIIHGKGTGVLRQTVTDMLRSQTHIKSSRLGIYGEGGSGVTIAELK